jgi:hypothetical protein
MATAMRTSNLKQNKVYIFQKSASVFLRFLSNRPQKFLFFLTNLSGTANYHEKCRGKKIVLNTNMLICKRKWGMRIVVACKLILFTISVKYT